MVANESRTLKHRIFLNKKQHNKEKGEVTGHCRYNMRSCLNKFW